MCVQGAHIPNFGRLTWRNDGSGKLRPIFSFNEVFVKGHSFQWKGCLSKALPTDTVSCEDMNFAKAGVVGVRGGQVSGATTFFPCAWVT